MPRPATAHHTVLLLNYALFTLTTSRLRREIYLDKLRMGDPNKQVCEVVVH